MEITTEMRATAQIAPAQVGNGQAIHYTASNEFQANALCGRRVSRVLLDREVRATAKECTRCVKAAQERTAANTPAPAEAPAATIRASDELTPQQARAAASDWWPQARAFVPERALDGTLLGYTFQARPNSTSPYGWITAARTLPLGSEPCRSDARAVLCLAAGKDRVSAPGLTPSAEAPATPADVTRTDDVKVHRDGRGKWNVRRGRDILGVIWDEGRMARGRFATWSPYAATPGGVAGFFNDPAAAVEAIVDLWPTTPGDIARETGAPLGEVIEHVDVLAEEWSTQGRRVYRTAIRGAAAKLTREADATVRVHMGLPSARYALPLGSDARTWPRFHRHDAAVRHAASYGMTADAVIDTAPQWRTLTDLVAPFQLWGQEAGGEFQPADDPTACSGEPVTITLTWNGTRHGQDSAGREVRLGGPAARFWAAPGPTA